MVERREIVGGACVTEEFAPGYRASTGAYILSMLRPAIWTDLRLRERGVVTDDAGPSLNLFPDGADLLLDDDPDEAAEAVRRFSPADAEALTEVEEQLLRLAVAARADLRPDGLQRRAPAPRATAGRSTALLRSDRAQPQGPRRGAVPPDHLGRPLPLRALRVAVRPGGPGLALDQRQPERARARSGPRTCCSTTTSRTTPEAGCDAGASCAAGWGRSPRRWRRRLAKPGPRSARVSGVEQILTSGSGDGRQGDGRAARRRYAA